MSSALRVRYALNDSMKAVEARYPGCPPFAEGEHLSLGRRAAASRHTQLLSGFPAGWVRHCCLRPQQRDERDAGTTFPINQQDLQSGEAGALHELWRGVMSVGKVPRQCWGDARQRVVVYVCCNTIWQGKLQEEAVLSRETSSWSVVPFVSSQETVYPFPPYALLL